MDPTRALQGGGAEACSEEYLQVPLYDPSKIRMLQQHLELQGKCELLRGLDALDIAALEAKFRFQFPPELITFLSVGVPVNPPKPSNGSAAIPAKQRASPFGWHNWHGPLQTMLKMSATPSRAS